MPYNLLPNSRSPNRGQTEKGSSVHLRNTLTNKSLSFLGFLYPPTQEVAICKCLYCITSLPYSSPRLRLFCRDHSSTNAGVVELIRPDLSWHRRAKVLCHVPTRASPEGQALQVVQQLRDGIRSPLPIVSHFAGSVHIYDADTQLHHDGLS